MYSNNNQSYSNYQSDSIEPMQMDTISDLKAREYQMEILEEAIKRNIIAYLETGNTRTLSNLIQFRSG